MKKPRPPAPAILRLPLSALGFLLLGSPTLFGEFASQILYPENGRLAYVSDEAGNRIPDFSHAGYRGGGVPLPDIPVRITISPVAGDNSLHIQNAINQAGAMPPDANGFRGAVMLNPGTYPIDTNLVIPFSGVVLRGSGDGNNPAQDSILRANQSMRNTVLTVGGNLSNWTHAAFASSVNITSDFIPVGARSFEVENPAAFSVGANIVIQHPSTQAWIDAIDGGGPAGDDPWTPGTLDIVFNRHITGISGNTVTVDVPVFNPLDRSLAQSFIYRVSRKGLVTESGVENLRIHIETAGPTDEDHAANGIIFRGVENGWAQNVTVRHFSGTAIGTHTSTFITIRDSRSLDPHSIITGGRRYPFNTQFRSNNILFEGLYSNEGRHCFVSNGTSSVSGIVFYNSTSHRAHAASEGHRRWSQGMLFDNITFTEPNTTLVLGLYNRGSYGTAHGWSAVHSVAWNCDPAGQRIVIQQPPTAQNYGIGNRRQVTGAGPFSQPAGFIEGTDQKVLPASLYQAQLTERLTHGITPDAPIRLQASPGDENDVILAWQHLGVEEGVIFLVERSTDQAETWQSMATVSVPTFTDNNLQSRNYRYRVRASGQTGLSAYSNPVEIAVEKTRAPLHLNFGTGPDNDDGAALLKNPPAFWSLYPTSLRYASTSGTWTSFAASASIINHVPGQGFALEAEVTLTGIANDPGFQRIGFAILGGADSAENPFDVTADAGFYGLIWYPSGTIRIREGFNGPQLASIPVPAMTVGATYTLGATGTYPEDQSLEITFTLTGPGGDPPAGVSTTITNPLTGNVFGIGGRSRSQELPVFDFHHFSLNLDSPADPSFDTWRNHHFDEQQLKDPARSGANGTPAGDGVANLIKYALNRDPSIPLRLEELFQWEKIGNAIRLRYDERLDIRDIAYHAERSEDLITWNRGDNFFEELSRIEKGDIAQVTLQALSTPRAFFRLQISYQP